MCNLGYSLAHYNFNVEFDVCINDMFCWTLQCTILSCYNLVFLTLKLLWDHFDSYCGLSNFIFLILLFFYTVTHRRQTGLLIPVIYLANSSIFNTYISIF